MVWYETYFIVIKLVLASFAPFGPTGQLHSQCTICLFYSCLAPFSAPQPIFHEFNLEKGPTWSVRMPLFGCDLGPPFQIQNRPSGMISVAKRPFSTNVGHFFTPLGPHLGHFESEK